MGGGVAASVDRGHGDVIVRDLDDFSLDAAWHGPGTRVERHVHARPELLIMLEGGLWTHLDDRSLRIEAGDVATHPAGLAHGHDYGPTGAETITLRAEPSFLETAGAASLLGTLAVGSVRSSLPIARRIRRELCEDDVQSDTALRALALQLVVTMVRNGVSEPDRDAPPPWLIEAKETLDHEFAQSLRITALATDLGVTPMQLIRAFQRHFNTSPGAYLRQVRLERALALLEQSDHTLASLALEVGLSDQSHLCRVVKAETGMTPSEYRRTSRA